MHLHAWAPLGLCQCAGPPAASLSHCTLGICLNSFAASEHNPKPKPQEGFLCHLTSRACPVHFSAGEDRDLGLLESSGQPIPATSVATLDIHCPVMGPKPIRSAEKGCTSIKRPQVPRAALPSIFLPWYSVTKPQLQELSCNAG